jgi:methyltransferase (TIGR00027 family)
MADGVVEEPVPTGVASTGITIAAARARESLRDDRLFEDPLAHLFVEAAPAVVVSDVPVAEHTEAEIHSLIAFGVVCDFWFVVRTRYFDDYVLAAAGAGHCEQVVILAAGLDTRAFRLDLAQSVRVFEIDLPDVFGFKERVLEQNEAEPLCERSIVPADLARDWLTPLRDCGFDPSRPTAWLAEGLMLYLTSAEAEALLGEISRSSAPGSQLAYEHGFVSDDELRELIVHTAIMAPAVATWRGGLVGDPVAWLQRNGWNARLEGVSEVGSALGREAPAHMAGALLVANRL